MNYTQYEDERLTKVSKNIAIGTIIFALIGIIAALLIIASGAHTIWALLIMVTVVAVMIFHGRIEQFVVKRVQGKEGNT